jgi:hypothetical protein
MRLPDVRAGGVVFAHVKSVPAEQPPHLIADVCGPLSRELRTGHHTVSSSSSCTRLSVHCGRSVARASRESTERAHENSVLGQDRQPAVHPLGVAEVFPVLEQACGIA